MRSPAFSAEHAALARGWRRLSHAATVVALLTAPAVFVTLAAVEGVSAFWALVITSVGGIKQMKGYEPGDADWGVRLDDVRGQKEPKEDVTRVIQLWQSGEEFRKAGGKPERGLLFIGAPGTGKTMLSKAIATSFNSPIMTMPGSASRRRSSAWTSSW